MKREDQVYDRELFVQVIESYQSIKYLRSAIQGGIRFNFYEGITGKLTVVEVTDLSEDVTFSEAFGVLNQLGVGYLIDTLYPPITEVSNEQELSIVEGDILKEQALKGL